MRRLLLSVLAASLTTSLGLHASTLTYSTCTAGTITDTPCPGNLAETTGLTNPPYNSYLATAFAQASDLPLGSISVLAEASATYNSCFPMTCPAEVPLSASAQAVVDDAYETTGPARVGRIQLNATLFSLHGNPSTRWVITDGPYTYSDCLPGFTSGVEGCSGTTVLPFELGVPFRVYATTGQASVSLAPGQFGKGAENQVNLYFSLSEFHGPPVAFFAVPEPTAYGLVFCAAIAMSLGWRISRTRRPPPHSFQCTPSES